MSVTAEGWRGAVLRLTCENDFGSYGGGVMAALAVGVGAVHNATPDE